LLIWLTVCAVYVAIGIPGLFELWFVTPLIVLLVVAQALEPRMRARLVLGVITIFLAGTSIVLGILMLVWPEAMTLSHEPYVGPSAISLISWGLLTLPCLIRRARIHFFSALGLNKDSALHTTSAVMFVSTLVFCAGIFVLLMDEPGETIFLDLKDPVVSLLTDIPLALAGVGFLLRRDFKESLTRLGFSSMTLREFVWVLVVTALLLLAVTLFDLAEQLVLPEIYALEERFPMQFRDVSPLLGIPAVSIVAGVGEEAVFRGALQPRFGISLTALLFAAVHVQYQLPGIALIFVIGIVLGVMRKRRSTTFTACVHMVYDIAAFSLPDF
jgi:membrane protease YdiL (CAAX protease family)